MGAGIYWRVLTHSCISTKGSFLRGAALDAVRQLEEDEWVPLLDRLDGSADQSNESTDEALSSLLDVDTVGLPPSELSPHKLSTI
jgi:hypothetical protein